VRSEGKLAVKLFLPDVAVGSANNNFAPGFIALARTF
jgi:hypothetical protein